MKLCQKLVLRCLLAIFLLYIVLLYLFSEDDTLEPDRAFSAEVLTWHQLCQFPELSIEGVEGEIHGKKLRGLAIIFRHGERSPLTASMGDEYGCTPFKEENRKDFEAYLEHVRSDESNYFFRLDKEFREFSKSPHPNKCAAGEMTAEGALRHLRLGHFMYEKYAKSSIFSSDAEHDIAVISSQYNRTFQSAIAFSTGFLYPMRVMIPQVKLKAANNSWLCTSPECSCAKGKKMRLQYEKEHREFFWKHAPAYLKDFAKSLQKLKEYEMADEPFQIMDVSLGRFICRHKPLPCYDTDKCLNFGILSTLLEYTTSRGAFMFTEGNRFITKKLQLMEAFGVLSEFKRNLKFLRNFGHSNVVRIFSGHDVTVGPLLRVLGVPFTDFPHYNSRLIIETYESNNRSQLFLRFIYNGEDVTSRVNACTELIDGLCPSEAIESLIQNIPNQLGTTSISSFCDKIHLT